MGRKKDVLESMIEQPDTPRDWIRCAHQYKYKLDELKPHPKNANKHTPGQIERLAKLFEYHGVRHPIIVSAQSGYIVAGHARLEAAKLNGYDVMPVDLQHFADDDSEYAFLVADNAIAEWAELDLAQINLDIIDLGPDFNVEMLGLKDFVVEPADRYDLEDLPEGSGDERYLLEIEFPNEELMRKEYDKLVSEGLIVRVKS